MDQAASGFVMRGSDRDVWVRAEDRAEWQARGYVVVEARASRVEAGPPSPSEAPAPAAVEDPGAVDLRSLTVGELRGMATEAGVDGASRMNKAQLVAALEAVGETAAAEVTEADGGWPAEG